jgi:hypothetical protein
VDQGRVLQPGGLPPAANDRVSFEEVVEQRSPARVAKPVGAAGAQQIDDRGGLLVVTHLT